MTSPIVQVENKFSTTTTDVIPSSGDFTVTLTQAPVNQKGWLTIDPDDGVLREVSFYHSVSGNNVSVYGVNRTNPQAHLAGASVKLLNVAELFNYLSKLLVQTFFIMKRGSLDITVFGGPVLPGKTASDTDLTVNNGVNYIWYKPSDNSINTTQTQSDIESGNGFLVGTVVAGGGVISSVSYERYVTGPTSLVDLVDVAISSPTDMQRLAWDATAEKFVLVTDPIAADAPSDGKSYARKDGSWQEIQAAQLPQENAPVSGSVTTDEGTYWKVTFSDGSYTKYKTDGIYQYDASGALVVTTVKTGTYSSTGMVYTDGSGIAADGSQITDSTTVARTNVPNVFSAVNTFNENTVFKKSPYAVIVDNGTGTTIDFREGIYQKTTLSGSVSLTFDYMSSGNAFVLLASAAAGTTITSLVCKKLASSGTNVINTYAIGGVLPDLSAGGVFVITCFCGDTAGHIFSNGPTEAV